MISTAEVQDQSSNRNQNIDLDRLLEALEGNGFEVEENKDSGAGPIDLVCKISVHPSLPQINCGFIVLRSDVGDLKTMRIISFLLGKYKKP
jgi:hypothetical protein